MKSLYRITPLIIFCSFILNSCKKDFLDAKPSTTIVSPTSLTELQNLLENASVLNSCTPALSLMACDDYIFVDYESWQSTQTATERNSYIWATDIYSGETLVPDWTTGYSSIFYCNNVLETLNKIQLTSNNKSQYNTIKGWALFIRAYCLYDLVRNFSPVYNTSKSSTDLGMPIRLKAGIDEIVPRSSVKDTYDQIIADLETAKILLDISTPPNTNRPSKGAAYALFSRIYLSMNMYDKAEKYADSTLAINSKLIDYNSINKSTVTPFAYNNAETLFSSTSVNNSYLITFTFSDNTGVIVNPDLIGLYDNNDLRLSIYFSKDITTGNFYFKSGYYAGILPFSGLATDEIYLIKAECLARRNETKQSLIWLNNLLRKRFPSNSYKELSELNQQDAINKVLLERRKELVWRTLRWSDLKRLNDIGSNITLTRILNGETYSLVPNSPKYVFPIPNDEISLSGIEQNKR